MAIPNNSLSDTPVPGNFLPPRNGPKTDLIGIERGGSALRDTSQGLDIQDWVAFLDGNDVAVEGQTSLEYEVQFTDPDVTELDLAFDQSMNPQIAYVSGGQAYWYWYDSSIPGYATMALPAGASNPRCTLDDKRPSQSSNSDVLLFWVDGNDLMMRRQRDRYTITYALTSNGSIDTLVKVGMGDNRRLHFEITNP